MPLLLVAFLSLSLVAVAAPPTFNGRIAPLATASPSDTAIPGTFSLVNNGTTGSSHIYLSNGDGTWNSLIYQIRGAYNPRDYGAKCDGTTNDSTALTTMPSPAYLNYGTCFFNGSIFSLTSGGHWSGASNGVLTTVESSTNRLQAQDISVLGSFPTYNGSTGCMCTAFDGDFPKTHWTWETYINGTATLGQPTSGYLQNPNWAGVYAFFQNNSGWNQGTANDGGRTGAYAYSTQANAAGLGDTVAYNCGSYVTGLKPGATDTQANAAGGCLNGGVTAGANGVNLDPTELAVQDNGYDVSAFGSIRNMFRTNNTGALNAAWEGYVVQSNGTKNIDAAFNAHGHLTIGLDLAAAQGLTDALDFPANSCLYPNATNTDLLNRSRYTAHGNTSVCYNSSTNAYEISSNGALSAQFAGVNVNLPARGTASSGTTDYCSNFLQLIDSHWNGSGPVSETSVASACQGNIQLKAAGSSGSIQFYDNGSGNFIGYINNGGISLSLGNVYTSGGYVAGTSHNACSSSSGWPCETSATCSISAGTSCNTTVTVPSGSNCTATPNDNDGTSGAEWIKLHIATTTLTVYGFVASSQTSQVGVNIHCL